MIRAQTEFVRVSDRVAFAKTDEQHPLTRQNDNEWIPERECCRPPSSSAGPPEHARGQLGNLVWPFFS